MTRSKPYKPTQATSHVTGEQLGGATAPRSAQQTQSELELGIARYADPQPTIFWRMSTNDLIRVGRDYDIRSMSALSTDLVRELTERLADAEAEAEQSRFDWVMNAVRKDNRREAALTRMKSNHQPD